MLERWRRQSNSGTCDTESHKFKAFADSYPNLEPYRTEYTYTYKLKQTGLSKRRIGTFDRGPGIMAL